MSTETATEEAWYAEARTRWSESRIFEIEGIRSQIRTGVRQLGYGSHAEKAAIALVGADKLVELADLKAADTETYKGQLLVLAEAIYSKEN